MTATGYACFDPASYSDTLHAVDEGRGRGTKNPPYRIGNVDRRSANTMSTLSSNTNTATAGGLNSNNRPIGNLSSPSVRHRPSLSSHPGSASSGLSLTILANGRTDNDTRAKGSARNVGMTRAERIAATHRHYDMRTAAEVLRRSPLPESAVWRKMRQIIGARLGWIPLEGGGWDWGEKARSSSSKSCKSLLE